MALSKHGRRLTFGGGGDAPAAKTISCRALDGPPRPGVVIGLKFKAMFSFSAPFRSHLHFALTKFHRYPGATADELSVIDDEEDIRRLLEPAPSSGSAPPARSPDQAMPGRIRAGPISSSPSECSFQVNGSNHFKLPEHLLGRLDGAAKGLELARGGGPRWAARNN